MDSGSSKGPQVRKYSFWATGFSPMTLPRKFRIERQGNYWLVWWPWPMGHVEPSRFGGSWGFERAVAMVWRGLESLCLPSGRILTAKRYLDSSRRGNLLLGPWKALPGPSSPGSEPSSSRPLLPGEPL